MVRFVRGATAGAKAARDPAPRGAGADSVAGALVLVLVAPPLLGRLVLSAMLPRDESASRAAYGDAAPNVIRITKMAKNPFLTPEV